MRLAIQFIKYTPIVINLWLVLLLTKAIATNTYFYFGGSYWYIFGWVIFSYAFKFCTWHRILIFSMFSHLTLELMQSKGITFNEMAKTSLIIITVSLFISTILYYKNGCYSKKKTCFGTKKPNKKHRKWDV